MPTMSSWNWQWLAVLVAPTLALYLYVKRPKALPLPPGLKKLPLIANLLDMPSKFQWVTFRNWAEKFKSDILHLNVAGTNIVVLDSAEAAYDLLEKKSAIYSSRPRMPMIRDLMGWDWPFFLMPYGDQWLEHRKLFQREFGPTCTSRYYPQQMQATLELLTRLRETPDDFMQHIRHMAGQSIISITYGIDILPANDPYVACTEEAAASVVAASVPGAYLVDAIPVLKYIPTWFPGAGFRRQAKEWRKLLIAMRDLPFNAVKADMSKGTARPSFTSSCLQAIDGNGDASHQETVIKNTAGTIYTAGSDATVSSLGTFILAMVLHPNVQSKAQKELDLVLGKGSLPRIQDEEALPYISAIVKEVLRWRPPTPMGPPHVLQVEDTYKGYRIPAGSICLPNVWAMLQNESTYLEPSQFRPERFIKDGKLNPEVKDPTAAWGFGRRICPGRFMAQSSIWIAVACILYCFDISKAVDENGAVIEPSGEYVSATILPSSSIQMLDQVPLKQRIVLVESSCTSRPYAIMYKCMP